MDQIRQPGKWLDDKLTQQESADFMKMLDTMLDLKSEHDPEQIINALCPYMNSFMHLMYLLLRNKLNLEATDEGIIYKDRKDTYFDIVGYVRDFILNKYDINELINTATNDSQSEIITTQLPTILAQINSKLDLPMDKGNRQFWDLMENTNGQYKIAADTLADKDKGTGRDSLILINVDMSANDSTIKLNREITTFDKYVYMAVDALYRANDSHTMTVTNIYKQMGNNSSPSSADTQKILNSLRKMGNTTVSMNNDIERQLYPNYPEIKFEGKLLEFRQITVKANGKATEGAIRVLDELPLMTVARKRKQFTTINRELLAVKMGKTAENLDIMDVLLDRIATIKSGHTNEKILYSYIYEHAKINTSKQRQRAPGKIRKILEYYKKCGHIKNYKESTDGVTIFL